jgi:hypothetical protein
MKAKTVNFERGRDPLDAMDLGIAKLKFTYSSTTSEGEYEIISNFGNIVKDDFFYAHQDDEQWDKLDKAEVKEEMEALETLLKKARVSKNGEIKNYEAIVEMEEYLDKRLSELFGAETYNGWEYERGDDCLGMKHEHAIIKIAAYCIAKCHVFLDVMK